MGNHRRTLRGRRRSKQTTNGNNALMMKALQAAGSGGGISGGSVTATAVITASVTTTTCQRVKPGSGLSFDPKTQSLKSKKCDVCRAECSVLCELCYKGFYCSDIHRKTHWSEHRVDCFPLECVSISELKQLLGAGHQGPGPYMKATKDIREKELIFEEAPLMTGPGVPGDLPYEPLCLGCTSPVVNGRKCSKCKWPVCSKECEKHPLHNSYECSIFNKRSVSELYDPFQYELVRILRCLLTKFRDPERFELLLQLDAALERRNVIYDLVEATRTAQLFVNGNCGLKFDRKIINHMCGVVDLQTQVMGDYRSSFQIFTFPSKLIHDCRANARLVEFAKPDGRHLLRVMAIRPIRRGDIITVRGIDTMNPTYDRQRYLWNFFYFRCCCQCCMDPTEMGTYFSAVRCMNCMKIKRGRMSAEDIREGNRCLLPLKPYDISEPWHCKTCKKEVDAQIILDMYQGCDTEFMNLREMIAGKNNEDKMLILESKVRSLEERFHPGNFQLWRVKQIMMGVMSQRLQTMDPPESWEKFKEFYREVRTIAQYVVNAVSVLQPGLSLSRGRTLYDLISIRWAYIQWSVIYGKAPTFMKHPQATEFLTMVAELLIIFKYESGVSTRAIVDDVYYMKKNLTIQKMRLGDCWDLEKFQESDDDQGDESDYEENWANEAKERMLFGSSRLLLKVHPRPDPSKVTKELEKLNIKK